MVKNIKFIAIVMVACILVGFKESAAMKKSVTTDSLAAEDLCAAFKKYLEEPSSTPDISTSEAPDGKKGLDTLKIAESKSPKKRNSSNPFCV